MARRLDSVLDYLDLRHALDIPMWREARLPLELLGLSQLDPPARATTAHTILLVPGFLDDGTSLSVLERRLRMAGHDVHRAEIGRNIDCTERMAARLADRLDEVVAETGEHVVLLGHSRGGSIARVVGVRRPDVVAGVIAVGSALKRPHDVALPIKTIKLGMRGLSMLGIPGLVANCGFGPCCDQFFRDLTGPFPEGVPLVSIYSPTDGQVAAKASKDPAARHVEVDATHVGLVVGPAGLQAIEQALSALPEAASA